MKAKYEKRLFPGRCKVWVGRYRNLHNLSHWHFESELIVCQKGSSSIVVDNVQYRINEGECILVNGESTHHIDADISCILIIAIFDNSLVSDALNHSMLSRPVFVDSYGISEGLEQILKEIKENKKFYDQIVNSTISSLIFKVFRDEKTSNIKAQTNGKAISRYKELLVDIEHNYKSISFDDAVTQMNMSPSYFSKFFTSISGMSFTKYLNIIKVENAVEMILKDPEITSREIIANCGFSTIRNFNRVFKEITGYTPTTLPLSFNNVVRTSLDIDGSRFNPTLVMSELL